MEVMLLVSETFITFKKATNNSSPKHPLHHEKDFHPVGYIHYGPVSHLPHIL